MIEHVASCKELLSWFIDLLATLLFGRVDLQPVEETNDSNLATTQKIKNGIPFRRLAWLDHRQIFSKTTDKGRTITLIRS